MFENGNQIIKNIMEIILYVVVSILIGAVIGWLIGKATANSTLQSEKDKAQQNYSRLENEFTSYKATSIAELQIASRDLDASKLDLKSLNESIEVHSKNWSDLNNQLSKTAANLDSANKSIDERDKNLQILKEEIDRGKNEFAESEKLLATSNAENKSLRVKEKELEDLKEEIKKTQLKLNDVNQALASANGNKVGYLRQLEEFKDLREEHKRILLAYEEKNNLYATSRAEKEALTEKLATQKVEIEALGKKFNLEFENIANKILDTKSEKFTKLNSDNLKSILEPLGQNINDFKKQVDKVYSDESKERFSLGEKVKELSELNKLISEEAHNLTKALKGESKTQGRWGEMILESILERSGLVKNREYFMEHELLDDDGKALKSDLEGKKMRPDAVIKYPDNRNVIIDSKVSLNAFTRLIAAVDVDVQKLELAAHISAIKNHIVALSAKGYDDYNKSLDFVMLFVPSEPAYIAALQNDPDLWNFAYDRRILLLSPTNLITSLKLIVDLWKREYQNQNALEIASRGAKLYDKFVGFIDNLDDVGMHLNRAQGKYSEAYKQLSTGNDNLVSQATKLKNLGLTTKKQLPAQIEGLALVNDDLKTEVTLDDGLTLEIDVA